MTYKRSQLCNVICQLADAVNQTWTNDDLNSCEADCASMVSASPTGDIITKGNIVGNNLVASGAANWSGCQSILKGYPYGAVYQGGGTQKDGGVPLGICTSNQPGSSGTGPLGVMHVTMPWTNTSANDDAYASIVATNKDNKVPQSLTVDGNLTVSDTIDTELLTVNNTGDGAFLSKGRITTSGLSVEEEISTKDLQILNELWLYNDSKNPYTPLTLKYDGENPVMIIGNGDAANTLSIMGNVDISQKLSSKNLTLNGNPAADPGSEQDRTDGCMINMPYATNPSACTFTNGGQTWGSVRDFTMYYKEDT